VYAIIDDRSRQFLVQEGDSILVDRMTKAEGEEVRFEQVICLDGKTGSPYVEGASVSGVVLGSVKGEKIYVQKFKRRKKYRRRIGHRQNYTRVQIKDIIAS
jgi:large subunit ribosomal protein L21